MDDLQKFVKTSLKEYKFEMLETRVDIMSKLKELEVKQIEEEVSSLLIFKGRETIGNLIPSISSKASLNSKDCT